MKDNMTLQMSLYFRGDNGSRWLFRPVRFRIPKPLLHITPLVPMFDRDIHTMLRGLRLDRYVFPLSAIRFSQGRRFPLRVTRPTEIASHSVGAHGAGACVQRQTDGDHRRDRHDDLDHRALTGIGSRNPAAYIKRCCLGLTQLFNLAWRRRCSAASKAVKTIVNSRIATVASRMSWTCQPYPLPSTASPVCPI